MIQRREFIKGTLVGMAGLALGSHRAFANIIIPQNRKLGVALVGLGYYSTDLLAPALQLTQNCYLAGIVTGTPAKAEKWKQQYNIADKNIYNYDNFSSLANNPAIDVIYIVLPPSMHAEYSIKAANAGKQVWCEKPMAMTAAECQSMIDAAKKNKVQLTIGYRMHHEPNTQKIMRFAKELPYGKLENLTAAAGYRARALENSAIGRQVVNWQHALKDKWVMLHFGAIKVETVEEQHVFDVQVYLGDVDPKSVRVEVYADAVNDQGPVRQEMKRVRQLVGAAGGYAYSARVAANRPAADYTVRVIPDLAGVAIPLEAAHILWQR